MPFEFINKLLSQENPLVRALFVLVLSVIVAALFRVVGMALLTRLIKATKTTIDDQIVKVVGKPIFVSVLLAGVWYAITDLHLDEPTLAFGIKGLVKSVAIIVWAGAAWKGGRIVLDALGSVANRHRVIQSSTVPMFKMVWQVAVIGGAIYFAFISWNIDVAGWMASAGIVGIAVGFAAKDTIANLFAGVFILTDAPYKVGDFIRLDRHRGLVTHIGLRSTRILTRDEIEVTVPNAIIGNQEIVNETGGPNQKTRIPITVAVAYGSDVDQVREVLLKCPEGVENVCKEPVPSLRFREFGNSGLVFQLRVWITEPVFRGRVFDAMNTKVYQELMAAGIEIPYDKRDIYIKEFPHQKS